MSDPDEITHLTQALAALKQQLTEAQQLNDLYHTLLLNVSDYALAYRIHPDGSIEREWHTEGFQKITGYSDHELDSRTGWSQVLHPADRDKAAVWMRQVIDNRGAQGEVRIITRNGNVRWLRIMLLPIWDSETQRVIRMIGAAEDITRTKEILAEQNNFITNAIHELSHPVSSILMRLHLMRKQKDQLDNHLDHLEPVANRLRRMLQDMREMAYLDRGVVTLDRTRISLQLMVSHAVTARQADAINLDVQLAPALDDHPLYVYADMQRIENAITNLLDNALQVTPRGETIHVQVFASPADNPIYAVLHVRHQGALIEPDHPSRVFHPFQRASEGPATHTGLELTITREIVRLHGGEASVLLNEDGSSTFEIKLLLMDDSDMRITREILQKPLKDQTNND